MSMRADSQALWAIRENVPVSLAKLSRNGSVDGPFLFKYDVSLPSLLHVEEISAEVGDAFLREGFSVAAGHFLEGGAGGEGRGGRRGCVLRVYCYGHGILSQILLRLDDVS